MIAAPKGYDCKEKHLGGCGIITYLTNKIFHPDGCAYKYFGDEGV